MKSLKNTLSKSLRNRKISPPHWQKTFFDHVLRNSESYADKWEYVSENPVRAGLVQRAEDWPFQGEIFLLDY
jgi:putative transposase